MVLRREPVGKVNHYLAVNQAPVPCRHIATAAEKKETMERTIDVLRGFTDCLPDANVKGVIYGEKAWQLGDIIGNPAMQEAYEMGKNV